ncbi:MAG TPA: efflux RND transporter periplasmic adaptor subunit [Candidatus Margulisiibacteriota bacterium]|nr:efflux RND transporter periplasmic adaptor subunit [Candidatus Margulisiibacteriota bacterium]
MYNKLAGAALALAALAVACGGKPELASLPPPEVAVSQPVEQTAIEYFTTTGRTAAIEEVDIRARVGGYLVKVNFQDGRDVKAGDVLFEIDPRPYEAEVMRAEGDVAKWQAQLRKAQADVARNTRLLPKGAASERELETSIAAKESAEAEIKATQARLADAKLNLEFATIVAPIDGRVSRTTVTKGNLIQPAGQMTSAPLTTLVKMDPIYAYFDVDERTLLRVRERGTVANGGDIRALNVPVEIGLVGETGFPRRGVIDFVDNRVDPSTGTMQARGLFDNKDGVLTPGMFVRVRVPLGQRDKALFIPERAIGTDQGNKYLLALNDKNVVEYRLVTLGVERDGLREILTGLQPGVSVIVDGIQRVRPGITVNPRPVGAAEPPGTPAAPPAAAKGEH